MGRYISSWNEKNILGIGFERERENTFITFSDLIFNWPSVLYGRTSCCWRFSKEGHEHKTSMGRRFPAAAARLRRKNSLFYSSLRKGNSLLQQLIYRVCLLQHLLCKTPMERLPALSLSTERRTALTTYMKRPMKGLFARLWKNIIRQIAYKKNTPRFSS